MNNISFTEFCKRYHINRTKFIYYLFKHKYIYKQPYGEYKKRSKNIAYPQYDTKKGIGLFEMNERFNKYTNKNNVNIQLTPKGQKTFIELHDKGEF